MADEPTTDVVPDDDGPECETCGRTTCPDADLPGFSEPVSCAYAGVYQALKDTKDCDYGCSRDYTNQAIRLWVVEAVEPMLAAARADERERMHAFLLRDDVRRLMAQEYLCDFHDYMGQDLTRHAQGMAAAVRAAFARDYPPVQYGEDGGAV